MPTSILSSVKQALGRSDEDTAFDPEIIMHTNAALSTLTQHGLGPEVGFAITNNEATWEEFFGGPDPRLNQALLYTYLSVRLSFDPPTIGYVLTAIEKMLEQAAWRLEVAQFEIDHPISDEVVDPDTITILDGGSP